MKVKVLGSGSSGNSYKLQDKEGNEILVDCGIKYADIAKEINFTKLDAVLISHDHL